MLVFEKINGVFQPLFKKDLRIIVYYLPGLGYVCLAVFNITWSFRTMYGCDAALQMTFYMLDEL